VSTYYELFLRCAEPIDATQIGAMQESLGQSDVSLRLELYRCDDQLLGFDLGVHYSEPQGARILTDRAFALGREHRISTVYDPQLGRPVSPGDEDEIARCFVKNAAFAESGAVSYAAPSATPSAGRLKFWLAVAGLGILVLGVGRLLQCATQ
jgi:hypothetical protein